MPVRRVIEIDEELCNGCGLCVKACHEGAIALVDGKARLMRDDYCDGLGDCLPSCPQGAIEFVMREAVAYDEQAVEAHLEQRARESASQAAERQRDEVRYLSELEARSGYGEDAAGDAGSQATLIKKADACAEKVSQLKNWPVQIKLAPTTARYFNGVDLLIAADCTAFAYADFQDRFLRGRVCLVGCPKLDGVDYTEKLVAIIAGNDIRSVTMLRMSVPCCGGLEAATRRAIEASGKIVPLAVAVISTDGELVSAS